MVVEVHFVAVALIFPDCSEHCQLRISMREHDSRQGRFLTQFPILLYTFNGMAKTQLSSGWSYAHVDGR